MIIKVQRNEVECEKGSINKRRMEEERERERERGREREKERERVRERVGVTNARIEILG